MSPADLDKAIKLVMDAPKSTVSTPVWNMLLGTIGRQGRLELMWKTFNDVSYRVFVSTMS
jgi:pentatricopeptide repeat protein